jgi:hypothetical protein
MPARFRHQACIWLARCWIEAGKRLVIYRLAIYRQEAGVRDWQDDNKARERSAKGWQKAGKWQEADKRFAKGWQESWLCVGFTWGFLASNQWHSPRTLLETAPGRAEYNFSQFNVMFSFVVLRFQHWNKAETSRDPELRIRILLVRIQIPVFASMRIQIPLFTLIADLDVLYKMI